MTMKKITIRQFADDLVSRIEGEKTIDCCKDEIRKLARLAKERLGDELIEVDWKDPQAS